MTIPEMENLICIGYKGARNEALLFIGAPGDGKTSAGRSAAKKLGVPLRWLHAHTLDVTDLRGFPEIDQASKRTLWRPGEFLPDPLTEEQGILFIDEIGQGGPQIQAALLGLLGDEHRIGEYRLPSGWQIIAATNRAQDKAGGFRLITPLRDRFTEYHVHADADSWQTWAAATGVDSRVRAFLRFAPRHLSAFDPSAEQSPTPRSWESLSNMLHALAAPEHARFLFETAKGRVGEGVAAEFCAFLSLDGLPDPLDILADPLGHLVPVGQPALLWSLLGALGSAAQSAEQQAAYALFATRLPTEFAALALRDLIRGNRKLLVLPEIRDWLSRHRGVLVD